MLGRFVFGVHCMKFKRRFLCCALAITLGMAVHAQSLEQSKDAYQRGDYPTALIGFRLLAEQGNVDAQYVLGEMYANGRGTQQDYREAAHWYRKASEQGDADAQFNLGVSYGNGLGVPKDEREAVNWYRKAAEQGHAIAQYYLGVRYDNGRGVQQDYREAASWYRKSAEQGYADAQYNLGVAYTNGQGVPQDDREAVNWYRKSAEQGNASAQFNLGVSYGNGRGVPIDDFEAVNWYRKAAEQGHASAQFNLGVRYGTNVRGVKKDAREEVKWYLKAAEQGHAGAQFNLGMAYESGEGVPQNDREAVNWYRMAAEQGNASAQSNLGLMYIVGRGVPKDEQQAYFWWLLASANGLKSAVKNRDLVEGDLSAAQRAQAQAAARNWSPTTAAQEKAPSTAGVGVQGGAISAPSRAATSTQNADSTGSGFRVARGAIVTNHHVVEGCSRLRVNGVAAQLRGSDARSDLALLNVPLAGPSTSLRAQRAAIGEPVAVAGYPLRGLLSGFNMTTGSLSSLSGVGGDTRLVQITAPVQPGNSGGPLLDSAGNLMGVVVSKLDAIKTAKITGDIPQNVNFAINANVLRSFLDAYSVDYETASSERAIATTAIAEKAKGFTVLVECWK